MTNEEKPIRPSVNESVARAESSRSLGDSRPDESWSRVNAAAEKPAKTESRVLNRPLEVKGKGPADPDQEKKVGPSKASVPGVPSAVDKKGGG